MTLEELQKALKEGKAVTKDNGETYVTIEDGKFMLFNYKSSTPTPISRSKYITFDADAFLKSDTGYEIFYKKPILTESEKKYLSDVIRPFRAKHEIIIKKGRTYDNKEFIAIYLDNDYIPFPSFNVSEMYKDMEPNKKYSLEELGL